MLIATLVNKLQINTSAMLRARCQQMSVGTLVALVAGAVVSMMPVSVSAQANGASSTTCTQSGTTVTCSATTVFSIPASVNLQSGNGQSTFVLAGAASNGAPTCSGGLVASPSTVSANTSTAIALTLNGCPTSGVTYAWAAPAVPATNPANAGATHTLGLAAGSSQLYGVDVCSATNAQLCTNYTTSVSAASVITPPALAGCSITGPTGAVSIGSSPVLSAQCSQGTITSYQWRLNGNDAASPSTGSSYSVPATATTSGATLAYSVVLTSANGSANPAATVSVATQSQTSCSTFGTPGSNINYGSNYVALNGITMGGAGATYIVSYVVGANDSSVGKSYLPGYGGTNSPVTAFSYRTVAVSTCPNDFTSSNAVIVASENYDFSIQFTTERTRAGTGIAYVQPGRTYYINIRNDNCPSGQICSLDGQYRNWNQ